MPSKFCNECKAVVPSTQWRAHRFAHADKDQERKISSRPWRRMRELALERDGYRCQICGQRDELEVHHLDGDWRNNELGNLETRCVDHNPRGTQKAKSF